MTFRLIGNSSFSLPALPFYCFSCFCLFSFVLFVRSFPGQREWGLSVTRRCANNVASKENQVDRLVIQGRFSIMNSNSCPVFLLLLNWEKKDRCCYSEAECKRGVFFSLWNGCISSITLYNSSDRNRQTGGPCMRDILEVLIFKSTAHHFRSLWPFHTFCIRFAWKFWNCPHQKRDSILFFKLLSLVYYRIFCFVWSFCGYTVSVYTM